jgi:membrane-associated phospholipid phosphatase
MPPIYALQGPQVEPEAGAWALCNLLRPITVNDLRASGFQADPFPVGNEANELQQLIVLYEDRHNTPAGLSQLLSLPAFFERPPAGAVLSKVPMDETDVKGGGRCSDCAVQNGILNGVELASLFEGETPGLWHRHVLNVLLDPTVPKGPGQTLSPPRQALIWQALDMAISSALNAAWYYKWVALEEPGIDYRQRPAEYAEDAKIPFEVLYDYQVERGDDCRIIRVRKKESESGPPGFSPGTPRHPAYPSGHSTYSAAASEVLGCLFRGYTDPRPSLQNIDWENEFTALADNIGIARLYGGVHWRSDHTFGQKLGKAVGEQIIQQLNVSGIRVTAAQVPSAPPQDQVENDAKDFLARCGKGGENFCDGIVPAPRDARILQNIS